MPLPNRVDPFGELFATPARGEIMGNRGGRFHLDDQTLPPRRRQASRHWIICELEFNDRPPRPVWARGYTELFFLDEVTALSAGHRPCAQCRWAAFKAYLAAAGHQKIDPLDRALAVERAGSRPLVAFADLPDGAVAARQGVALGKRGDRLLAWSAEGWRDTGPVEGEGALLTPATTLKALAAGYQPRWAQR